MKKSGTDCDKSSNIDTPSQMRRTLLMGCAYLPAAPLLAMLGGCDSGGSESSDVSASTFETQAGTDIAAEIPSAEPLDIGLPPYSTTDVDAPPPAPPPVSPDTVQVTHIPQQPPAPPQVTPPPQVLPRVIPARMNVGVFSLQYLSFTQVAARRQVAADTPGSVTIVDKAGKNITYEAMETYLKRALDNRLALVYRAMVTAFAKHSPTKFDVSFVTAPELFWNVPWSEFLSEDELQNAADLCLDTVTRNVRTLISKFPADKYGKIVLLPGTVAMLKPNADIRLADGTLATADGKAIVYEALNQVICAHNLPLDDKDYPRPAYMIWPKRTVSTIDYADKYVNTGFAGVGDCKIGEALAVNPANPNVKNKIMNCTATGRSLRVAFVGSSIAQSFDAQGRLLSRTFQNDIVEGLPFGVNICLDYNEASVLKNSFRMAELDERIYKLDFLIAARMALDLKNYANTPYIQYALRNDGFSGGITQAWKLIWTKGSGASLGTMSYNDLAPLDADSPVGKLKGAIAVDESDAFVAPEGMDTAGIPKILDKMNACYVRIWALDVDTSDAVSSALHVSSAQSAVRSEEVQFIE